MNINQGRAAIKAVGREIERRAKNAVQKTVNEGLKEAIWWSSGTLSSNQLRKMDHPFARRHGSPLIDPTRINVQSGEFIEAWQGTHQGLKGLIINDSEHADQLKYGTERAFARPIEGKIADIVHESLERNLGAVKRQLEDKYQ